jgi:hypothetical protein
MSQNGSESMAKVSVVQPDFVKFICSRKSIAHLHGFFRLVLRTLRPSPPLLFGLRSDSVPSGGQFQSNCRKLFPDSPLKFVRKQMNIPDYTHKPALLTERAKIFLREASLRLSPQLPESMTNHPS